MELWHKQNNVRNKNISMSSAVPSFVKRKFVEKKTPYAHQGFIYLIKKNLYNCEAV